MKTKSSKNFTKTSFLNETTRTSYRGVANAYDLNRTGHFCETRIENPLRIQDRHLVRK